MDAETRYRKRYLDLLVNEDARRDFVLRSAIVASIRRNLDAAGFIEVETPALQPRYGGAFAEPFVTHSNELDADLYLRIATELYLKRLIVGGLEKVYELGKDFRNEGVSYKHQPEFTMLEWYEAYADYTDTMERIESLVAAVAQEATGTTKATFRGYEVDLAPPWQRLKLVDALEELGLWTRDEADLRARLEERGVDTAADRSWSQLVDHALSHFIEPELIQPTILYDYPVELSPFARRTDDDPAFTERFEYFAAGMELGNAYSELNDPEEQAARFAEQAAEVGGVQGDPDYVEALAYGMPPTGGPRARHRPVGDAPDRARDDPGRDPLPGPARAGRTLLAEEDEGVDGGARGLARSGRTAIECSPVLRQLLEKTTARRAVVGRVEAHRSGGPAVDEDPCAPARRSRARDPGDSAAREGQPRDRPAALGLSRGSMQRPGDRVASGPNR